jgi:hypothetical protein
LIRPYREFFNQDTEMQINLHYGQQEVWDAKERFILALLYREIQEKGEGDYLVGSASFPLLDKKLLPVMTKLFCDILHWGRYRDSDKMILSHDEKSKIFFFTGVNPEAIESATAKGAVLDECGQKSFRLGTWEAVQGRLAINQGRALLGTTPYDFGWLKTEVYDRAKAGDPLYKVVNFDSIANPMFPIAEYERMRLTLPLWKFDMFYRGQYTRPAGLVYDKFDDALCIVNPFPIPKEWLVYTGHDFGLKNAGALFYAVSPTGDIFCFEEYLPKIGRSVADHVAEFQRITKGMNVIRSTGGNPTTEDEIRQAYTAHGWRITLSDITKPDAQMERVYALDTTKQLKIFRNCRHYIDEKLTFSYELDEHYDATDKLDNESAYHMMACERYCLSNFIPKTVSMGGRKIRQSFGY